MNSSTSSPGLLKSVAFHGSPVCLRAFCFDAVPSEFSNEKMQTIASFDRLFDAYVDFSERDQFCLSWAKLACQHDDLFSLSHLLFSTSMTLTPRLVYRLFQQACTYGHLRLVQFFLTSPRLASYASPDMNDPSEGPCDLRPSLEVPSSGAYSPLALACMEGSQDLVEYLLHSPELDPQHLTPSGKNGRGWSTSPLIDRKCLDICISFGRLDLLRYFFSPDQLRQCPDFDFHFKFDSLWRDVCHHRSHSIAHWLVLNVYPEITPTMHSIAQLHPWAQDLLRARQEHDTLMAQIHPSSLSSPSIRPLQSTHDHPHHHDSLHAFKQRFRQAILSFLTSEGFHESSLQNLSPLSLGKNPAAEVKQVKKSLRL